MINYSRKSKIHLLDNLVFRFMLTLLTYFVFLILALMLTLILFIGLNKIQIL
ncbi:hypothetical protein KP509_01G105900 [Ceratopteris richardii]|uniref:Cytochrome b6-f complex subunit 6 n=3 Tax=Ceratopteris TaxID=29595 RepID=A0A8T2VPD7_CERRI|nr:hypothetical protein KP509_1Z162200 [Ceratopteris richardii]KAH7447405.1 hypothetical protein KP509_01G105900 [Ceratopteris richardii]